MEVFNYATKKNNTGRNCTKGTHKSTYERIGHQDLFKSFVAAALEGGLEAELDEELGYSKYDYRNKETNNIRNGYSKKTMKTSFGGMDIDIPRDRNGDFEPKLIQKHQTTLSGDIEEKIISMYAKGMTENDIATHIEEIEAIFPQTEIQQ